MSVPVIGTIQVGNNIPATAGIGNLGGKNVFRYSLDITFIAGAQIQHRSGDFETNLDRLKHENYNQRSNNDY
jgi:hypothetical protein